MDLVIWIAHTYIYANTFERLRLYESTDWVSPFTPLCRIRVWTLCWCTFFSSLLHCMDFSSFQCIFIAIRMFPHVKGVRRRQRRTKNRFSQSAIATALRWGFSLRPFLYALASRLAISRRTYDLPEQQDRPKSYFFSLPPYTTFYAQFHVQHSPGHWKIYFVYSLSDSVAIS